MFLVSQFAVSEGCGLPSGSGANIRQGGAEKQLSNSVKCP